MFSSVYSLCTCVPNVCPFIIKDLKRGTSRCATREQKIIVGMDYYFDGSKLESTFLFLKPFGGFFFLCVLVASVVQLFPFKSKN